MADNQSFDSQNDETLENRLIIKCNSDTFASTRQISSEIARMSAVGNKDWKINKVTLPITYGRYQSKQSISMESLKQQKSSKHAYVFRLLEPSFQAQIKQIPQNYKKD